MHVSDFVHTLRERGRNQWKSEWRFDMCTRLVVSIVPSHLMSPHMTLKVEEND